MQVSKGKKQAMNLKEKGEGYMGQFGGRKGQVKCNYNLKNKQQQKTCFNQPVT